MASSLVVLVALLLGLLAGAVSASISRTSIGLEHPNVRLMAFADFNGDKRTDALVLLPDAKTLHVYWRNRDTFYDSGINITETRMIENVVGGDFNLDGHMDILVTGPSSTESPNNKYIHIWLGDVNAVVPHPIVVADNSVGQVLVMDRNGDRRLDLYGVRASDGKRAFWVNQAVGESLRFETEVHNVAAVSNAAADLMAPHANAFVDLDGDCLADLFVSGQGAGAPVYEVWKTVKTANSFRFELKHHNTGPKGAGQPVFADFDGDGTIDVAVPVCEPADTCAAVNEIHIYFNKQKEMCSSTFVSHDWCRGQSDLCSADPDFSFSSDWASAVGDELHVIIPTSVFDQLGVRFTTPPAGGGDGGGVLPPVTLRAGDINMDGYADLLLSVTSNTTGIQTSQLWLSVPCAPGACNPAAIEAGKRTLRVDTDATTTLSALGNTYAATFYDLGDDGTLDIIALTHNRATNASHATGFRNEFYEDAYFVSALISNGVCPAWCENGARFPDPKPYGVNHVGNSIKLTVTDLSGTKHPRQGVQLPRSSHLPLDTPYMYMGIGRTYNYIEELYVAIPIVSQHYNMFAAILPNSQLIAFPFPVDDPASWTLELFVSPSESLVLVVVSLAVTLAAIGTGIIYLHMKERKQDQHEQQREHLFTF